MLNAYKKTGCIGGYFERFSVFLLLCPECGHVELDVIRKNYIYGVLMIIFGGITIPRRESV